MSPRFVGLSFALALATAITSSPICLSKQLQETYSADSYRKEAKRCMRAGRFDLASQLCSEALKHYPEDADLHLIRANSSLRLKDWKSVLLDSKKAVELEPKFVGAYTTLAAACAHYGRLKEALKNCDKSIELSGDTYYWTYQIRAQVLLELGKLEQARKDIEHALKIEPRAARVYLIRAEYNNVLKKYKNVVSDCSRAIAYEPGLMGAYSLRGTAHAKLGELKAASKDFDRVLGSLPDSKQTLRARGIVAAQLGEYEQALEDIHQSLDMETTPADRKRTRQRMVRVSPAEVDRLIGTYDKLIKLSPEQSESFFNRAILRTCRNDYKGAISDFEQFKKLSKNRGKAALHASMMLAYVYARVGRTKSGLDQLKIVRESLDHESFEHKWPTVLIDMWLGKVRTDEAIKLARNNDTGTVARCQIILYLIAHGACKEISEHEKWLLEHGNAGLDEYFLAMSQISRKNSQKP